MLRPFVNTTDARDTSAGSDPQRRRSVVTIPNRKIIGEILHNYGTVRQLNLHVGVAYGTDLPRALSVVHDILQENPRVLKDPEAVVGITLLD